MKPAPYMPNTRNESGTPPGKLITHTHTTCSQRGKRVLLYAYIHAPSDKNMVTLIIITLVKNKACESLCRNSNLDEDKP